MFSPIHSFNKKQANKDQLKRESEDYRFLSSFFRKMTISPKVSPKMKILINGKGLCCRVLPQKRRIFQKRDHLQNELIKIEKRKRFISEQSEDFYLDHAPTPFAEGNIKLRQIFNSKNRERNEERRSKLVNTDFRSQRSKQISAVIQINSEGCVRKCSQSQSKKRNFVIGSIGKERQKMMERRNSKSCADRQIKKCNTQETEFKIDPWKTEEV